MVNMNEVEVTRLRKIIADLTEANRKKRNRINHQKQHIKRLQARLAEKDKNGQ